MATKYGHKYRMDARKRNGIVRKSIDFPEQTWTDMKTHVDRLNRKGKKWTIWGALQEGMRLFQQKYRA